MKLFNKKFLFGIFTMLLCAVFGIVDGHSMGLMTANAVVTPSGDAGVAVTRDPLTTDVTRVESPDLILDTVDQRITKMRPSITPIDQILRHGIAKKAGTMQFEYYSVDIRDVKITITGAVSAVTTQDYADITVDNGNLVNRYDTIFIPTKTGYDEAGNAIAENLVLYVRAIAGNVITVQAVNGGKGTGANANGMYVPAITANTVAYLLAPASAEGDVRVDTYSALPEKEYNYCQIFKCEVGESTIQRLSNKEVQWDATDIEEQAIYEWRMRIEASYVFGSRRKFFDSLKKKYIYTTGGIYSKIGHKIDVSAAPTDAEWVDITKEIFSDNNGSERRLLLPGSDMNARISKTVAVQKQLAAGKTEVVWGITWNLITTNFGTLYMLPYNLLNKYGKSGEALVIDPQYLDKWTFKATERTELDLKTAGIFDGDVTVLTDISGPALKYPKAHAILKSV